MGLSDELLKENSLCKRRQLFEKGPVMALSENFSFVQRIREDGDLILYHFCSAC